MHIDRTVVLSSFLLHWSGFVPKIQPQIVVVTAVSFLRFNRRAVAVQAVHFVSLTAAVITVL